jgi:hypothetical protein
VGDDTEQDGEDDGGENGLYAGIIGWELLDDEECEHDRGEAAWAEPADEQDGRSSEAVPSMLMATGAMRMMVRLSIE